MSDNKFELNLNNLMGNIQEMMSEKERLEAEKAEIENLRMKLEAEVENLKKEKDSIILERDKTLEINKNLYDSLDKKVNDLIKENSKLENETVSKKDYLSLMKLNGYLIFDLEEALRRNQDI